MLWGTEESMKYLGIKYISSLAVAGFLLTIVLSATAFGQQASRTIIVSVEDASGAVVPGAIIELTQVSTKQMAFAARVIQGLGQAEVSHAYPTQTEGSNCFFLLGTKKGCRLRRLWTSFRAHDPLVASGESRDRKFD